MPRPIHARIDLDALRNNFSIARSYAPGSRLWAVVKADAYGHGVLPVVNALRDLAEGFALVEFEGAVLLREQGIHQPLLMLEGMYERGDLAACIEYDLTPVVHEMGQVEALAGAGLPTGIPLYLKLNTGMNRLGFSAADLRRALLRLEGAGCASEITLMTHFADADEARGVTEQMARFVAATTGLSLPVSLANSAALLRFPETVASPGNWARPGIMLYGSSPFSTQRSARELGLRPVMTLQSEIIAVQHLQPGDRVGYGGSFVAVMPMRVGVVACGYADGYPRHAPTGTPVLVAGQRTRTLGRVSMDKLCVDLTSFEEVGVGDTALMWGGDDRLGLLPADEVATAAGTIAYELFCALAGRVEIDYVSGPGETR